MLLVFIDETTDQKFKTYLGFCIATVNARFYPTVKRQAQAILSEVGWDPAVEFKGSYLFSATSGCTDVEVVKRIEAAGALLDLNTSKSNSRMRFYYGRMASADHRRDYLAELPVLLGQALPAAPKGAGKNLIAVMCDERTDISPDALHEALLPAVSNKGYVLLERPSMVRSSTSTVGIMLADLVCYLVGRVDTISNDAELFQGITEEQFANNGKIRKLRSSTSLMGKIRQLSIYTHESLRKGAA